MISLRALLIGLFTGIAVGAGWIVFIDAQINTPDAFPKLHILPVLGITLCIVMINLVSVTQVGSNTHVKVWLFIWVTIGFMCVGSSIWILLREYPAPLDQWPGISILIQTTVTLVAGFVFFIGRKPLSALEGDGTWMHHDL